MSRPVAIFLMGPSGSGKSTIREALNFDNDYVIASSDDVLMRKAAEAGISYQEAYRIHAAEAEQEFLATVMEAAEKGYDLIIDRTLLTPEKRRTLLEIVGAGTPHGHRAVAVPPDFDVASAESREMLLARAAARRDRGEPMPAHVVEAQIAAYVPPSYQEGFDDILPLTPEKAASSDRPWEVDRPGDDWF